MSHARSVSILDGSTFAVSDRRGDMEGGAGDDRGLFRDDTRFLSRWVLTLDGRRPNVLSIDDVHYFKTQLFLALTSGTVYVDSHLSVVRRREIADGFVEVISATWTQTSRRSSTPRRGSPAAGSRCSRPMREAWSTWPRCASARR